MNFWLELPFLRGMNKKAPVSHLAAVLALTSAILPFAVQATGADSTSPSDHPISAFVDDSLDDWDERSFNGNTDYQLVTEEGVSVLRAHAESQASVLYREQKVNLLETPVISWSWKVDRVYKNIDEKTKKGDDFPARLYVAKQFGFLPWESMVINYVWASDAAIGDIWTNPYSKNAKMVVIQSGDTYVDKWTTHSRNVAQDFKDLFDLDVEELDGYAVMVDGDNNKVEAVAWFGAISFSTAEEPKAE